MTNDMGIRNETLGDAVGLLSGENRRRAWEIRETEKWKIVVSYIKNGIKYSTSINNE
jgi:hypothetical protein